MLAELKFYDVDFSTYHGNPNEFLLLSINGGMACIAHARTDYMKEQGTRCSDILYSMFAKIAFCISEYCLVFRFVHETFEPKSFCFLVWINMFIEMK